MGILKRFSGNTIELPRVTLIILKEDLIILTNTSGIRNPLKKRRNMHQTETVG